MLELPVPLEVPVLLELPVDVEGDVVAPSAVDEVELEAGVVVVPVVLAL
ncbi:MAG: hypothetical protein QOH14_792, partial [Pseudonocardiales bacterium]|nr:hypothetical protein [Pseudonocardiales bacterium]